MLNVNFKVGEVEDKLSLAHALEAGYHFRLDGDGEAEVSKPDGTAYYVVDFVCDCPDAWNRNGGSHEGHCKHAIWVAQLRPCECCGGAMALGELRTAFGSVIRLFSCPDCGNARETALVTQERRERREIDPCESLRCPDCHSPHEEWDRRCPRCDAPLGWHEVVGEMT